jgi:uncharacterized protein with HEPN domain
MPRDEATLLDIAKAGRLVLEFVQGMAKETFLDDLKTQSSVLYQLIVIGEAVKRLSHEFRAQHAEISWMLIAGMRDHLIHAYDMVDWDEVWNTATRDVPDLLARIEPLLPTEPIESP